MSDEQQAKLLTEIRDVLREQLEEYRRVTSESLTIQRAAFEAQQRAVETQQRAAQYAVGLGRLYRISLGVLAAAGIIGLGLWLVSASR